MYACNLRRFEYLDGIFQFHYNWFMTHFCTFMSNFLIGYYLMLSFACAHVSSEIGLWSAAARLSALPSMICSNGGCLKLYVT